MIITITPPKAKTYYNIVYDSQKYFCSRNTSVFESADKSFYVFIEQKEICVNITHESQAILHKVEEYIDSIFGGLYIGMSKSNAQNMTLKNVEVYYLWIEIFLRCF